MNTTIVCLTTISLAEILITGTLDSMLLWIGYGIYKLISE